MTVLSPNQFAVLRSAATEPPGYSAETEGELEFELNREYRTNTRRTARTPASAAVRLHHARQKFSSGRWPAFYDGVEGAIEERPDDDGSGSIEIVCANCRATWATSSRTKASHADRRAPLRENLPRYDPSVEQPDSVERCPPACD